jgi:hypothetical protein
VRRVFSRVFGDRRKPTDPTRQGERVR